MISADSVWCVACAEYMANEDEQSPQDREEYRKVTMTRHEQAQSAGSERSENGGSGAHASGTEDARPPSQSTFIDNFEVTLYIRQYFESDFRSFASFHAIGVLSTLPLQ